MLEAILGAFAVGVGAWAFYLWNRLRNTVGEKTQYGIILEMATQERESLMMRIEELSGQLTGMQSQVGFLQEEIGEKKGAINDLSEELEFESEKNEEKSV